MSFTFSSFIFLFAPLAIIGNALLAWIERKSSAVAKLRISELFLVAMSLTFYLAAGWQALVFLVIYILALWLATRIRRTIPAVIAVAVAILFYTKYIDFSLDVLSEIAGYNVWDERIIFVPLGISFITFSSISYAVDVRRDLAPRGSLLETFFYISFFPKVISGPIVLWRDFAPQLSERHQAKVDWVFVVDRIIVGFAKKVIIADTFGALIAEMNPIGGVGIDVPTAWLIVLLYFFQIYFDFSGYSDIAIGISAACGIRVKENFNFPYISTSITEFWRRWHISLGTWFREYLYIPLGGNRRGQARTLANLSIVFIATGVWHGAGWGYLLWGMAHGAFMVIERLNKNKRWYQAIPTVIKWIGTQFIVAMGWIVFIFGNLQDSREFVSIMLGRWTFDRVPFTWDYYLDAQVGTLIVIAILGAFVLGLKQLQPARKYFTTTASGVALKSAGLLALAVITFVTWINSAYSPFIYFQY